jgi:hypothetical protein
MRFPSALIIWLAFPLGCAAPPAESPVEDTTPVTETARFSFHSNLWVNLNHYLYKLAGGEGRTPVDSGQLALVASLPAAEREIWDRALAYYAAHHIDDNIRTDDTLFTFKRWVVDLPADSTLRSEDLDPEWIRLLNEVAPIYRERFWPAHDAQNRTTLDEHLADIRSIENAVFERLATLARYDWPEGRIRVDVSYYSNWAGAYTTNRPVTHVVMSSVDIQPPPHWLELVFHESSHSIIGGWSPLGQAIDSAAAAHDRESPGQLWHAFLFYFSGRVVQDELAALGREHTLYMMDKDVFSQAHPLLLEHMEPYVAGEVSLEQALEGVFSAPESR